jgi:hypothetical protein
LLMHQHLFLERLLIQYRILFLLPYYFAFGEWLLAFSFSDSQV